MFLTRLALAVLCLWVARLAAQQPEPLNHWQLHGGEAEVPDLCGQLPGLWSGGWTHFAQPEVAGVELDGSGRMLLGERRGALQLPREDLTVEALVMVFEPLEWGGIVGYLQDNGDVESGWLLGFREDHFCVALASEGADDGNGSMTYLSAEDSFETGRWYHLAASYDGEVLKLYVDGELAAEDTSQSGPIHYPEQSWYEIGAYHDDNEEYGLRGKLAELAVFDQALSAAQIRERTASHAAVLALAREAPTSHALVLGPYLQHATAEGIRILWQTEQASDSRVRYGQALPLQNSVEASELQTLHELELHGLEPGATYFYQVSSRFAGGAIESELFSFQTALPDDQAYAFVAVSDSQSNPDVWQKIAAQAWGERPNFVIHAGDLVGTGSNTRQWINEFLRPAATLMARVPLYSVLGNHEQDAKNYYDYMANPEPEHRYSFHYGNAQFFMLDSNRDCSEGSEQFRWLEANLAASEATWKFVVQHHPPFTSDSDDYGDAFRGTSARGDRRVQPLIPLYETYGVDIVFFGHIHDYERSWPLRDGKIDEQGVTYLQIGGAGGGLEDYAPTRSWFTAKVRRTHHYCLLSVHAGTLRLQVYDLEGRMFDSLEIHKD